MLVLSLALATRAFPRELGQDARWLVGLTVLSLLWLLYAMGPGGPAEQPLTPTMSPAPTCKICDNGRLKPKEVYRLGGVVATIGYLLLLPSVISMGLSIGSVLLVYTEAAKEKDPSQVEVAHQAAALATLMGGGMFLVALVGGLLGWLLVLKKRMLQCDSCGATVAAS